MGKQDISKTKLGKAGDAYSNRGDIIVLVMGPKGVGKSSFINSYLGQEKAQVGHDLQAKSRTATLQAFISDLPPDESGIYGRLVLVDTPGFEDNTETDSEILRRIATWLASIYGRGMRCGGLIYLHDITDLPMRVTTFQNLRLLQGLCGNQNLGAVVFGIVKSDQLSPEAYARQEKHLSDMYWKDFMEQGAIVLKLLPSRESAQQLVKTVLDREGEGHVLLIQEELVDLGRELPATEAGKKLRDTLNLVMKQQKRYLTSDNLTEEQTAAYEQKIAAIALQIKQLTTKLSFSQRLLRFFGLGG